ncbi:uncharacterized protein LOC144883627 [Branchiostoma floridae x Branchiostoma japonicum]
MSCLQIYNYALSQQEILDAQNACDGKDEPVEAIPPSLSIADFQFKEYTLTPAELRTIDSYLGFELYLPMEDMKEGEETSVHASSKKFIVGECNLILADGVVGRALQLRGRQEKSTGNELLYSWQLPAIASSPLMFEVKTGGSAHIALSRKKKYLPNMYEVVIGDTSEIRRTEDSKIAVQTPGILDQNVYKQFWISWTYLDSGNISIAVGKEEDTVPFMQWTDPLAPLSINYAGYSTDSQNGYWKFGEECQASVESAGYVTDASETFSILLWAKFKYPLKGGYFATTYSSPTSCGLSLEAKDDQTLEFKVQKSQKEWSVDIGVTDQHWVHLAFAWNKTGNLDTYINGIKQFSVAGDNRSIADQNCFDNLAFNSLSNEVAWEDRQEFLIDDFRMDEGTFEEDRLKYIYAKDARIRSYYFSIDARSGNILLDGNRESTLSHLGNNIHLETSLNNKGLLIGRYWSWIGGPYHYMCLGNPSNCLNGFSLSLWFKEKLLPAVNGSVYLISAGDEMANSPDGFHVYHQGWGDLYVIAVTRNGTTQKVTFGIREGLWTHVHMSWLNDLRVTINGAPYHGEVQHSQEQEGGLKINSTILKLGAPVNQEQIGNDWQIVVDDIRIWEEVVSVEDAKEEYASLALKREYRFFSKGQSNFGEFPNDCLGSSIYCTLGFTVAAWILPTATSDEVQTMLSNSCNHTNSRGFTVMYDPATQMGTVLLTTVDKQFSTTFPMLKDKWIHVVITWDIKADEFILFLNGRRFLGEIETDKLQVLKTDPHTAVYFQGRYRLLSSTKDSSTETIFFKEGNLPTNDVLTLYENGRPIVHYDIPMTTTNGSFVEESYPVCSIHGDVTRAVHNYRPHLNFSGCGYLDCGKLSLECLVDHTMCHGMGMTFTIAYSGLHPVKIMSVIAQSGDELTSVDCDPGSSGCAWNIEDAMLNFTVQPDEWNFIQLTMSDKYEMKAYVNGHFMASMKTDLQFESSFNTTTIATLKLGAMVDDCVEGSDSRVQFAGWWFKDRALRTSELDESDPDWDAAIYLPMDLRGQVPAGYPGIRTSGDTVQLVDGMVGKAARIDGSGLDQLVTIEKANLPRSLVDFNTLTRGYTVCLWLFAIPTGQDKNYYLDFNGDHHNSWGFSLYHDPVEKHHAVVVSTPDHSWKVTFPPYIYRWTHVAFGFNPKNASVSLFLDGMFYKTSTDPVDRAEEPIDRSVIKAAFGARYAAHTSSLPSTMMLDEFRFIERPLTAEEVFIAFRSPLGSTIPTLCMFCGGLAPGSKVVNIKYDPTLPAPVSYQESNDTAFSVEDGSLQILSYRTFLQYSYNGLRIGSAFTLGFWLTVNRELQGSALVLSIPEKGVWVSLVNSTSEEAHLSVSTILPADKVTMVKVLMSCQKPMLILAMLVDESLSVHVNGDPVGNNGKKQESWTEYSNGLVETLGSDNGTEGPLFSLKSVLFWNGVIPTTRALEELTGAHEEHKWDFTSNPDGLHLNGYADGDLIPLGMESWGISDDQLSAANRNTQPAAGRLNTMSRVDDPKGGGWCATGADQWLQVDFGRRTYVKGVMTQGHSDTGRVTSYHLSFSLDGDRFFVYSNETDGSPTVFAGNDDVSTIVRHVLDQVVVARFVRFIPQTWNAGICMRVEVLGSTGETKSIDTNIAIGKSTTQSSTAPGWDSYKAVDSNKRPYSDSNSCMHTVTENDPWWSVDLGQVTPIDRVVIYNRQDRVTEDRINPFNVHIGSNVNVHENDKCGEDHIIARGQAAVTVYCGGMEGRYVGIRLPGNRILNLCEVEVYSTSLNLAQQGVVRWRNDNRCGLGYPAPDGRPAECHPSHGNPCCSMVMFCGDTADHCACPNCVESRKEGADFNVAQGKPTRQSSTGHGGVSSRAVDGNRAQDWRSNSCMHTEPEYDPWWSVDLGSVRPIDRVVVYNRLDGNPLYINPFNIHIGNIPNVEENGKCGGDYNMTLTQSTLTAYCGGMEGRYVGIKLVPLSTTRVLHVCEVEVYSSSISNVQQVTKGIQCSIPQPVGMESGSLPNDKITASSRAGSNYDAIYGRLNQYGVSGTEGGWGPSQDNINQWLQVEVGLALSVTGVITQGSSEASEWVTSYKLQFSMDGSNWVTQMDQSGVEQIFEGNFDRNTIVTATLPAPVATRYVRFLPQTWKNKIRMRVEILACSKEPNLGRIWMDTNVAKGKPTSQSSTDHGGVSSRAVDGNRAQNWQSYSCMHTNVEYAPWWSVDLGNVGPVDRVVIYNRLDAHTLMINPFNIHIGHSPNVEENGKCGGDYNMTITQSSLTVYCGGMEGRYVGIRLVPLTTRRVLNLCEVEVYSNSLYNIQEAAASQWTSLGHHAGTCLTDPQLCLQGFTLALSFRHNKRTGDQVILSSGGGSHSSNGFFFEYVDRLFEVGVNDGPSLWKVRFDMRPEWTDISFSWHPSVGLTVQLDGVVILRDAAGIPCDGCSAGQKSNNEVFIGRGTAVPQTSMEFRIKHMTFFEGLKDLETLAQTEDCKSKFLRVYNSLMVVY